MISISLYKDIADLINSSQERGQEIVSSLYNMRQNLSNSEVSSQNVDKGWLYDEVDRTYEDVDLHHNEYIPELYNFVKKLQLYITEKYGSVNNFLRDNGETVFSIFADISNQVGYEIDADLIQSESDFCNTVS